MSTSDENAIMAIATEESARLFTPRKRAILNVSYELLTVLMSFPDDVRVEAISPDFQRDSLMFRLGGSGLPNRFFTEPGECAAIAHFDLMRNADGSLSARIL